MSDLISRKALLERLQFSNAVSEISISEVLNIITNAPAIEQGEPVAWMIWWDDREWLFTGDREDFDDATKYNFPITQLHTAPPQPQTVKNALEKAASIVQAKIGHYYPTPLTDAVTEIRALIEKG